MSATIYISNDNLLEVRSLYDEGADAYVNDATVTVTLEDIAGTEIVGETWPLSLSYVSASNGIYQATLADTLTLTAGTKVVAKVTADGGAGKKGYWEKTLTVANRTG